MIVFKIIYKEKDKYRCQRNLDQNYIFDIAYFLQYLTNINSQFNLHVSDYQLIAYNN